jgi:Leucine-rich repeat (LRR) protein
MFSNTKFNARMYCSKNESLTLDNVCIGYIVKGFKCVEVISAETNFPLLSNNSYSRNFYSIVIWNKNYYYLPDNLFQTLRIEQLDLSSNQIAVVGSRAFGRIAGLRSLALSNNNIKYIELNYLIELEVLDLRKNEIERVERSMLVNLTKLKYLDLSSNYLETIDNQGFKRNTGLRRLDLSGNKLKSLDFDLNLRRLVSFNLNENELTGLTNGIFSNLTSLIVLILDENNIVDLDSSQFMNQKQMKILTIKNNYIERVDFEELTSSMSSLITLYMPNNNIQSIKSGNSSCNQKNKIQDLDIHANKIKEIGIFSFSCFGSLTSLELSNQMLTDLPSSNIFYGLINFIDMSINNNSLTRICNNTFIHLGRLSSLDLASNRLEFLDYDAFQGLENLTRLKLSDNRLKLLRSNTFKPLKKLTRLDISANKLAIIEPGSFFGLENSLEILNIDSNRIQFLKNHFFNGLCQLSILNLKDNQISSIQRDTFKDIVNLTVLNLADNSLAQIDSALFLNTPRLVTLDLSLNVLVELKPGSFSSLKQLKSLNLGFNSLVKVNFQKVFLNKSAILLEKLNLENNLISEFDLIWFVGLNRLTHLNMNSLNMKNNDIYKRVIERKPVLAILPNLRYLNLTHAPLSLVRQFNLSYLIEIDLSYSQLDSSIIRSLPYWTIQKIKLAKVKGISSYNFSALEYFDDCLKFIDLSSNGNENPINFKNFLNMIILSQNSLEGLSMIDTNNNQSSMQHLFSLFPSVKNLIYLDLSKNRIAILPHFFIYHNQQLVHLNLSHNFIKRIEKITFVMYGSYGTPQLAYFDLSYNRINFIEDMSFYDFKQLVYLDLRSNMLKDLDQMIFGTNRLLKLTAIFLSDNRFLSSCEIIFGNPQVNSINLKGNNLTEVPSAIIKHIQVLDYLDFSSNQLKAIKKSSFRTINGLYDLLLSENKIEIIEADAFVNLKTLAKLDLSFNQLSNMSKNIFNGLYNLALLNLSSNKLEILQSGLLVPLYNLEKLDLTNNSIKSVDEDCFIQNGFLSKIYLQINPLRQFFKNHSLTGLVSLNILKLPETVEINNEACFMIQNSINVRYVKQVLNYSYFYSVDIFTLDIGVGLAAVYKQTECFQILYLARFKINLQLFNLEMVRKFVQDCSEHIADAFVNNDLPSMFKK